jgi:DNA-binding response OmpR family regulator
VRTPADPRDVQARVETLRSRAMREVQPQLDAEGRLHVGDRWVALSPIESRLVATLLDHLGTVTRRELLMQAGWSSEVSSRKLDVRITRLRRRLESVGFTVRTVYGKGYVIDRIAIG